jgi:hypothetical protein
MQFFQLIKSASDLCYLFQSVNSNGWRARTYIGPSDQRPSEVNFLYFDYSPWTAREIESRITERSAYFLAMETCDALHNESRDSADHLQDLFNFRPGRHQIPRYIQHCHT